MTKRRSDSGRGRQDDERTESKVPFFFEQMERQMEIWNEFMESDEGMDVAKAGLDFAQISARHMAEMFSRIGGSLPEDMSPEEVYHRSREIYLICANSYSEMFKEAMATSSIPKQNARMIDIFLNWKIATDRANQEMLRNLGVPTQEDMDEIAEKLYWLNKKMDDISKSLRNGNGRYQKSKSR